MYFPYLRGKQYELIAVDDLAEIITTSEKVLPIIEPIKNDFNKFKSFVEKTIPFILINNPMHGALKKDNMKIKDELIDEILKDYDHYYLAYIITQDTALGDLDSFLQVNEDKKICIIHYYELQRVNDILKKYTSSIAYNIFIEGKTSRIYRDTFQDCDRVLIRDGFNNTRNADYPDKEYFSDLNLTYSQDGYSGFGDFLIVGDTYSETGGPAHAVAIHHSYINEDNSIWMAHFKSDTNNSPVNPAGKFFEALIKFKAEYDINKKINNKNWVTNSCNEFAKLYEDKHFPGLGTLKKVSMKHHIEIILHSLNK